MSVLDLEGAAANSRINAISVKKLRTLPLNRSHAKLIVMDRESEIEIFKLDIPLPAFCAGEFGYVQVPKKSSPHSVMMKNQATGSKIAIQRNAVSNHWTYWSVSDHADNGSIVDLVQHRTSDNLGQVRKRLRPWLGGIPLSSRPIPAALPLDVTPTRPDLLAIRQIFATTLQPITGGVHVYLNQTRGLAALELLTHGFAENIFTDRRCNALFPHRDQTGITGWESRNHDWKSFSADGYKSLWWAGARQEDRKHLVFAESAIDAISYGLLHPNKHACYLSTGGQLSELQRDLVGASMAKLPKDGRVIIAADRDHGGDLFTLNFVEVATKLERDDLQIKQHTPPAAGKVKDWNDVLRSQSVTPTPTKFDFI